MSVNKLSRLRNAAHDIPNGHEQLANILNPPAICNASIVAAGGRRFGSGDWHDADPCRYCGHSGWCSVSADGRAAICRRPHCVPEEVAAQGEERTETNGAETLLFRQGDTGKAASTPRQTSGDHGGRVPRNKPNDLDKAYRSFLRRLTLSAAHRAAMIRRGLPDDDSVLTDCFWLRSVDRQAASDAIAGMIADGHEHLLHRTPGFIVDERSNDWTFLAKAGLLIPVMDAGRNIVGLVVRPDLPAAGGKYVWASSSKDECHDADGNVIYGPSPGSPCHVVPGSDTRLFRTGGRIARITEGAIKASVATYLSGMPTLGLAGCSGWRSALAPLAQLGDMVTTLRLAWDADARCNPTVAASLVAAVAGYRAAGYTIELETWDIANGKGIDDLLHAGKTPTVVTGADVDAAVAEIVGDANRTHAATIATAGGDGAEIGADFWGLTPLTPDELAAMLAAKEAERIRGDAEEQANREAAAERFKARQAAGNRHYCDPDDHNPYALPRQSGCGMKVAVYYDDQHYDGHPDKGGKVDSEYSVYARSTRCRNHKCPQCGAILCREWKEHLETKITEGADAGNVWLVFDSIGDITPAERRAFDNHIARAGAVGTCLIHTADGKRKGRWFVAEFPADADYAKLLEPDYWRKKDKTPEPTPPAIELPARPVLPFEPGWDCTLDDLTPPYGRPHDQPPRPANLRWLPRLITAKDDVLRETFTAINRVDPTARRPIYCSKPWQRKQERKKCGGRMVGIIHAKDWADVEGILSDGKVGSMPLEPRGDWKGDGLAWRVPLGSHPTIMVSWINLGTAPPDNDWTMPPGMGDPDPVVDVDVSLLGPLDVVLTG